MPRAAVAVATSADLSGVRPTPDREMERQLSTLGRQIGYGRRFRPGRPHIMLIALLAVGVWLFFVFAGALGQMNEADARRAVLAADSQALEQRLDAGRRELQVVQTDGFQALQARGLGLGEAGEQVFWLDSAPADAPPITPLGGEVSAGAPLSPLEAWLALLFGD